MKSMFIKTLGISIILATGWAQPGQAQLIDVMSNLAIQGQMAGQSAGQTKTALSMLRQNEIINQMNLMIADIQTRMNKNYTYLSREQILFPLAGVDWNIGPVGTKQFFIELKNIDSSSCSRFIMSFQNTSEITINGVMTYTCEDVNNIKFIFD